MWPPPPLGPPAPPSRPLPPGRLGQQSPQLIRPSIETFSTSADVGDTSSTHMLEMTAYRVCYRAEVACLRGILCSAIHVAAMRSQSFFGHCVSRSTN